MVYSDQDTVLWLIIKCCFLNLRSYFIWDSYCPRSRAAQTWSLASWRPGPAAPICGPTSRSRCRRWGSEVGGHWWGGADTQLIRQVIKWTLHNVHNMQYVDSGLIFDVVGCNSKLQTQDQQNILVWLWMNSRQYQELVEFLCGITADP